MDTDKQIAIKGAELLGMEWTYELSYICVKVNGRYKRFDPVNNANDMNRLIEALKIDVTFSFESNSWEGMYYTEGFDFVIIEQNESRDEAIRQCVIKALGLHKDSEALGVDND